MIAQHPHSKKLFIMFRHLDDFLRRSIIIILLFKLPLASIRKVLVDLAAKFLSFRHFLGIFKRLEYSRKQLFLGILLVLFIINQSMLKGHKMRSIFSNFRFYLFKFDRSFVFFNLHLINLINYYFHSPNF